MNRFKTKHVSLRTIQGIEEAEALQATGWKIIASSIDVLIFEKLCGRDENEYY